MAQARAVRAAAVVLALVGAVGCSSSESLGVKETSPANGATDVSPTVEIRVTFTRPVVADTVTHTSLELTDLEDRTLGGVIAVEGAVATFTPSFPLTSGQRYRVQVLPAILNDDGRGLASAYAFEFTVTEGADTRAPQLVDTLPEPGAAEVDPLTEIRAVFDELLDPASVALSTSSTPTVTVALGAQAVATPAPALPLASAVRVELPAGLEDLAGNARAEPVAWTFFTRDGSWQTESALAPASHVTTTVVDREERHTLLASGGAGAGAGVVWIDAGGQTQATALDPLGQWVAAVEVGTEPVRRASLAANPGGDLLLTWEQDFTGRAGAAAFRRFDGATRSWEPGWHFVTGAAVATLDPCAGVGAAGHAWVLWAQGNPGGTTTYGRSYAPGTGWSDPLPISTTFSASTELGCAVAVDAAGSSMLLYQGGTATAATLLGRVHSTASGLGTELTVSPFPESRLGNVYAQSTAAGDALVLWQSGTSASSLASDSVWYRRIHSGGAMDAPELVVHTGLAAPARYAVDPAGRAYVAWLGVDGALHFAHREDSGWLTETIPTPGLQAGSLSLSVDPRGNALVTFDLTTAAQLHSVRWIRGLGWRAPLPVLSGYAPYPGQQRLVTFADGSALSLRVAADGGSDLLSFSQLK